MASNTDKQSRQQRAEQMRKARERADAKRRNLLTVGIVVVVVVLIAVAGIAIKSQVDKNNAPAMTPKGLTSDGGVVYDKKAATGTAAAASPVSVVLYEDFQCPICKAFEAASGPFLQQQVASGTISLEYRPVAFLDSTQNNDYSSRAASAAMCVFEQKGAKGYQAMLDLLYPNQPDEQSGSGLPDEQLAAFAKQAGATDAESCVKDNTYQKWAKDAQNGSFKKYGGTPTVLVNGKVVNGPEQNGQPTTARTQDLQAAIAAAAK